MRGGTEQQLDRRGSAHCFLLLTFTGTTLTYEPHHEGGAAVTLGGRVERFHHELMCFGLRRRNKVGVNERSRAVTCHQISHMTQKSVT